MKNKNLTKKDIARLYYIQGTIYQKLDIMTYHYIVVLNLF